MQFSETEVDTNFDIAPSSIHVERFIGCICDCNVLSNLKNQLKKLTY